MSPASLFRSPDAIIATLKAAPLLLDFLQHIQIRQFLCVDINSADSSSSVAPRYCPSEKPNLGDPECPLPPECLEPEDPLPDGAGVETGGDSTTDSSSNIGGASGSEGTGEWSGSGETYTVAPALGSVTGNAGQVDKAPADVGSSNGNRVDPKAKAAENTQFLAAENQGADGSNAATNSGSSGASNGGGGSGAAAAADGSSPSTGGSSNSSPGSTAGTAPNTASGGLEGAAPAGAPTNTASVFANTFDPNLAAASEAAAGAGASGADAGPQGASDIGNAVSSIGTALDNISGLPLWMLEKPTASLSAILQCPADSAISANGTCCNSE